MYDREVWTKAGAAGLLCPVIPEEYGGVGGTFAHEAVIARQLSLAGFDSFGAPLHSGIVAPYILHYGTDEQKRRWLPKLVTGELVGAIAMSEPGTGSDLQAVRTTANKSGNGYVLNGSKTMHLVFAVAAGSRSSASIPRTPPNCSLRTSNCRRRTCSARRRVEVSLSSWTTFRASASSSRSMPRP
jgi:hypothetical protein